MKTLTKTQRTNALRNAFRNAPVRYENPYLFDVRNDREIKSLLRDSAEHNTTVDMPAGAYYLSFRPGVERMYDASAEYALVSPKGRVKIRESGMPANHNDWLKTVKKWIGIKG